jgi:hypothetical protein
MKEKRDDEAADFLCAMYKMPQARLGTNYSSCQPRAIRDFEAAFGSIVKHRAARLTQPGSPHRSMSASTTRPVPRSIPLLLSIVARRHEDGLMHSWRADSLYHRVARSRNYPHVAKVTDAGVARASTRSGFGVYPGIVGTPIVKTMNHAR